MADKHSYMQNIAGTIEVNESIEEKEYLISKLKKKLKSWRGIYITGLIVLLIILLYVIYVAVAERYKTIDSESIFVAQKVRNINYCLQDKVPTQIDLNYLEHKTLGDYTDNTSLVINAGTGHEYEYVDGSWVCIEVNETSSSRHEMKEDDDVITVASLEEALAGVKRDFEFVESIAIQDYKQADMLVGGVITSDDVATQPFYSSETIQGVDETDLILQRDLQFDKIKFTVYEDIDESVIKEIIESALESNITCALNPDYNKAYSEIAESIKVNYPSSTIDFGGVSYSCFDSVETDEAGQLIGTLNGEKVTPEKVTNISVDFVISQYNPVALAYFYKWF